MTKIYAPEPALTTTRTHCNRINGSPVRIVARSLTLSHCTRFGWANTMIVSRYHRLRARRGGVRRAVAGADKQGQFFIADTQVGRAAPIGIGSTGSASAGTQ